MGSASSQPQPTADMSHRNRIVIGPSMSPTPESEDSESAQRSRKVIGPSMSPTPESEDRDAAPIATTAAALPIDNDLPSPDERSSKKKRRKKKDKRRKSLDSVTLVEDAAAAGIDEAGAHESTKRGSREKRKRKKSRKNHPDPGEANALTDGSDPDSPIKSVEESPSSPKRKNKRSKNKATHGDELPLRDGMQEEGLVNGDFTYGEAGPAQNDDFPAHAPGISQSPKSARKKRGRGRKEDDPGGAPTSDAHQALLSHAIGGSPPSAQPPRVDDILKYEPLVEDDEVEASVVPDSQWQQPQDLRFHFTGIPANFADAVTDPVAEARRENDPQSGLGWLHKRENALQDTPVTNSRGTLLDTALPDLQPIQVKIEPQSGSDSNDSTDSESSSSSDESNSQSPSVQRLERLSRSRSRSTSRAPSRSGFLADQTVSDKLQTSLMCRLLTVLCSLGLSPLRDQIHTKGCPTAPHRAQDPIDLSQLACPAHRVQARIVASQLSFSLDPVPFAQNLADLAYLAGRTGLAETML